MIMQNNSQNFEAAKALPISLVILIMMHNVYGGFQHRKNNIKNLHQSQFSLPPITSSKKHCKSQVPNIQNGVTCFKNKEFAKSRSIFLLVKEKAISNKNLNKLTTVYLYLALIELEEKRNAESIIKHLFFLKPSFLTQGNNVIPPKYLAIFKRINKQGRNIGETETDDISKKTYLRVSGCQDHCKKESRIWQEWKIIDRTIDRTIDSAIDCSLTGTCDDDLNCSLTGTCDNDLDCSLNGNCKN